MPRALRLATLERRLHTRAAELARIFAQPVEIETSTELHMPAAVAQLVRDMHAISVLADSFRGDLQELRRAVAPVPVLRPQFERRPGAHAGPPENQFCGYGLLNDDGDVDALADGALAP
jgi:hypothetical protein